MEITFSLEEIDSVAQQILSANIKNIVLFHAGMGVGKTTLIKALAKQLGVQDMTSSPTFSLVNEYETENGNILYHFDLYRLNTEEEAYDMGMVNKVVSLENLEDEVVQWCYEMMEKSPIALRMIKCGLNAELDGQAGIQELAGNATLLYYFTEEAQEGKNAFLEKRKPDFKKFPKFP